MHRHSRALRLSTLPARLPRHLLLAALLALLLALGACASGGGGGGGGSDTGSDGGTDGGSSTGDGSGDDGSGDDGSGSTDGGSTPPDTTAPGIVRIDSPSGLFLAAQQTVVVQWTESMAPGSLALSGSMANATADAVWSSTDVTDDTVTLTNSAGWATGAVTLRVDATDLAGNAAPTAESNEVVIAQGTWRYVDFSSGTDSANDGTDPDVPLATITAALTLIDGDGGGIAVAGGTLSADANTSPLVTMESDVTLIGGFNSAFTAYNPGSYETTLTDTATSGSPDRAIHVPSTVTGAVIDSLTLNGGDGINSYAVFIEGDAIVRNCTISGGDGSSSSFGVYISDTSADVVLEGNSIAGGTSSGLNSYAVRNLASSNLTVRNNTLTAGSGGSTSNPALSIANVTGTARIEDNSIEGGGSGASSGVELNTVGSATLVGNVISGGTGGGSRQAINAATVTTLHVEDNDIFGGSGSGEKRGIFVQYGTGGSGTIVSNRIDGGVSADSQTVAVYQTGSNGSSTVTDNWIHGGEANTHTFAIYSERPMEVERNRIYGGDSNLTSNGVFLNGVGSVGTGTVHNNLILTGSTGTGQTGEQSQRGIHVRNFTATVLNNTVLVDSSGDGANRGIWIEMGSTGGNLDIANNLIVSPDRCVQANDLLPVSFLHNNLADCTSLLYVDNGGITDVSPPDLESEINGATTVTGDADTSFGNVIATPAFLDADGTDLDAETLFTFDTGGALFDLLVPDGDFHLDAAAPDSLRTGGLRLDAAPHDFGLTDDLDGTARTDPWSLGAYEAD